MTKNLLTALLIAGFSATAKAEPTVYYCEMKGRIELMPSGEVVKYNLDRFPMKVEGNKVSFGGDGYMKNAERTLNATFDPAFGIFVYYALGEYGWFVDNVLTVTGHIFDGREITAFTARCDSF